MESGSAWLNNSLVKRVCIEAIAGLHLPLTKNLSENPDTAIDKIREC